MQSVLSLTLILILAILSLAGPLPQEPTQTQTPTQAAATELTNKDVLDMLKSGLATHCGFQPDRRGQSAGWH